MQPEMNVRIVKAKASDANEILQILLDYFIKTEPLCLSLGIEKEESIEWFENVIIDSLSGNVSYIARVVTETGDPGKIVGISLCSIINRHAKQENETQSPDQKLNKIKHILNALELKLWEKLPAKIKALLSIDIICLNPNYARMGIAKKMIDHVIAEATKYHIQGLVAQATSFKSQKLFEKFGFKRLYEILHINWQYDKNVIFQCADGTDRVTLEFMQIKQMFY